MSDANRTDGHLDHHRVVVTGIGVVSPLGSSCDAFWQSLCEESGMPHDGKCDFTGKIDQFGPLNKDTKRVIRKSLKLMNRETQLGVAAAQHAIADSGFLDASYDPDRVGVCFGAGNVEIRPSDFQNGVAACQDLMQQFDPSVWGQLGIPHIDPLWILRVLPNMPACHTAIANDFRGPNNTITHARVATNMAFAEATHAIIDGDADAMIVGGTGTNFLESITDDTAGRPMPAEAAASFAIERLDRAVDREVQIYGEILASGSATAIKSNHQAIPDEAVAGAIKNALHQTKLDPQSIASIQMDRQSNVLRDRVDEIGDAAAGSSGLSIAALLLAFRHGHSLSPIASNIDAMDNGLASCLIFGNGNITSEQRRAA